MSAAKDAEAAAASRTFRNWALGLVFIVATWGIVSLVVYLVLAIDRPRALPITQWICEQQMAQPVCVSLPPPSPPVVPFGTALLPTDVRSAVQRARAAQQYVAGRLDEIRSAADRARTAASGRASHEYTEGITWQGQPISDESFYGIATFRDRVRAIGKYVIDDSGLHMQIGEAQLSEDVTLFGADAISEFGHVQFRDGGTYTGELIHEGERVGVRLYPDGSRYEGEFRALQIPVNLVQQPQQFDVRDGFGVLWDRDGKILHEGRWTADAPS